MSLTAAERRLRAQVAANARWAETPEPDDRLKATEPGRRAAEQSWETKADPVGALTPAARRNRAKSLRRRHLASIALRASRARRNKADNDMSAAS